MSADDASSKLTPKARKKKAAKEGIGAFLTYFVMMGLFAGLTAAAVMYTGPQIVDDLRLHFTGTLARKSSCEVYEYHGTKTRSESLIVTWTTQQGVFYVKTLDTLFLWGPNQKKPCIVRYDPAHPSHVTASWGFQRLISRILVSMLSILASGGATYAMGSALVMGIARRLGWAKYPESDAPAPRTKSPPSQTTGSDGTPHQQSLQQPDAAGLRDKTVKLSQALHQLVSVLESNAGPDAAYARALGSQIEGLATEYDHAIFVTRDRDQAAAIINTVIEEMGEIKTRRGQPKRRLGLRYFLARSKFRGLKDIFRESRYSGDAI
jgi:hypothetical protein